MFPLPAFLLSPTTLLAALAAFLAAIAASFFLLYRHEVSSYAEFRADVEQAQKQAAADAALRIRRAEQITNDTVAGWSAAVAHLKRNPRIVRVQSTSSSGGVSAVSSAGLQLNGTSAEPPLGSEIRITAAACEALVDNAVQDAAQLAWLQHWVSEQSKVTAK